MEGRNLNDFKLDDLAFNIIANISLSKKKSQTNKNNLNLAKSMKLNLIKNIPFNDICNICFDNFKIPITLLCNHRFCSSCINDWFNYSQLCPVCKKSINHNYSN